VMPLTVTCAAQLHPSSGLLARAAPVIAIGEVCAQSVRCPHASEAVSIPQGNGVTTSDSAWLPDDLHHASGPFDSTVAVAPHGAGQRSRPGNGQRTGTGRRHGTLVRNPNAKTSRSRIHHGRSHARPYCPPGSLRGIVSSSPWGRSPRWRSALQVADRAQLLGFDGAVHWERRALGREFVLTTGLTQMNTIQGYTANQLASSSSAAPAAMLTLGPRFQPR